MIDDDALARIPLFAGLNESARAVLRDRGVVRQHGPGAVLWRRGEAPRGLFVVLAGEVRVVRDGEGRRSVVHTEVAGGTLGEIPLFEDAPYPATAIASRRTTCLAFDRATVIDAMRADTDLALALLQRLARRVHHLIDRLDRLGAWSVTARLAAWLDTHAPAAGPFTLGRTQQEVAEELGTVREVVVRELRGLREAGILESVARGRFRILDRTALRDRASRG